MFVYFYFVNATKEYVRGNKFEKLFTLRTGRPLSKPDDMFTEPEWQLNDFQHLKTSLNRTKEKLDTFD